MISEISRLFHSLLLYTPVYMIFPSLMPYEEEILITSAMDIVNDKLDSVVVSTDEIPCIAECVIIPASTITKDILECDQMYLLRITDYDCAELVAFNDLLMDDGVAVSGVVKKLKIFSGMEDSEEEQEDAFNDLVKIIENTVNEEKYAIENVFIALGYTLDLKVILDNESIDEQKMDLPQKTSDKILKMITKLNK